ncbi:hypothetical protein QCN29_36350 [Streptomyces sp. HNM0663]|uniref:Uncharacterized protein n=1 Tax=Streptomyces chengmaiensis TaxID=3040919 RepID=A0ABT6I0B4_9ACTN|nr:hypothetical protein [Streptomyces chengmaiensis]MDH2394112.1 hypothetical protein [Streptomyces chengmaiensis]
MAVRADHEGLAAPFGHQLRPRGLWSPRLVEVGKLADLVGLHRSETPAPLAPPRREPGEQLFAADGDRGWLMVDDDRCLLPS